MGGEQSKIDTTKVAPPATHCHFSMKILIKGDNNTGKSSLFNRLQRKRFIEEHQMTPQSTSATIEWEFPMSGFRVKIEVWDVVEAAKKKAAPPGGLKIKVDPSKEQKDDFYNSDPAGDLDPETQRLIENTNAVIFMVNPFKKHTLDYVKRVIPQLPENLDILIVINYKDQGDDKRTFSLNDVMIMATDLGENVKYCEASMSNSFGIKAIKSFLNIPYAKSERIFLEEKLALNENNLISAEENYTQTFKEQDYKFYKDWLEKTMKERIELNKKGQTAQTTQVNKGQTAVRSSTAPSTNTSNVAAKSDPKPAQRPAQSSAPPAKGNTNNPSPSPSSAPENSGGLFSKLKSMVSADPPKKSAPVSKDVENELKNMAKKAKEGKVEQIDIDEFDPSSVTGEKDSFDSFFDDEDEKPKGKTAAKAPPKAAPKAPTKFESDSEEEFNPLVTADKDDIDSDLDNEPSSILSHFSVSNDRPSKDVVKKPKKIKQPKPSSSFAGPSNDNNNNNSNNSNNNNKNDDNDDFNVGDDEYNDFDDFKAQPSNNKKNTKAKPQTFEDDDDDDFGNPMVTLNDDEIDDDFFDEPKQAPKQAQKQPQKAVEQKKPQKEEKFDQKKNNDKNQSQNKNKKNPVVVSNNFDDDDDFAVEDDLDDSWLSDTPADQKKNVVKEEKKPVAKPAAKPVAKEFDDFYGDNDQSGFDADSFYTPSSASSASSSRDPVHSSKDEKKRRHRSEKDRNLSDSRDKDRHRDKNERDKRKRSTDEKPASFSSSSSSQSSTKPTKNPYML